MDSSYGIRRWKVESKNGNHSLESSDPNFVVETSQMYSLLPVSNFEVLKKTLNGNGYDVIVKWTPASGWLYKYS